MINTKWRRSLNQLCLATLGNLAFFGAVWTFEHWGWWTILSGTLFYLAVITMYHLHLD